MRDVGWLMDRRWRPGRLASSLNSLIEFMRVYRRRIDATCSSPWGSGSWRR
jgi:hypothetical protein